MVTLEDADDGETYIDTNHEKVTPRQQEVHPRRPSFDLKKAHNLNSRLYRPKPEASPGKNVTRKFNSSSNFQLPPLVRRNSSLKNNVEQATKANSIGKSRLPEVEKQDDNCEICQSERARADRRRETAETKEERRKEAVSFIIPFKNEKSHNQMETKEKGNPPQSSQEVRPKTSSRPKSRFAAPSSLATPSITDIDIRESKDKQQAPAETSEVSNNVAVESSANVIKVDLKVVPGLPPVRNILSDFEKLPKHSERKSPVQEYKTLRGTVIPEVSASTSKNESRPNIVIPTRLLAGISPKVTADTIDTDLAVKLKQIVFGSPYRKPTDAWRMQSLGFSAESGTSVSSIPRFVITQLTNTGSGSTGALSVVQAELLKQILYKNGGADYPISHKQSYSKANDPYTNLRFLTRSQRSDALGATLAEIITRAASSSKNPFASAKEVNHNQANMVARVVIPCGRRVIPSVGCIADDGITEKLLVFTFPMDNAASLNKELRAFFRQHLVHFDTDGSGGVLLCLYSAVLSRGIDTIYKDVDEVSFSSLITPDTFTSTEALNLLLTGIASSFFFNDTIKLESEMQSSLSSSSSLSSLANTGANLNESSDSSGIDSPENSYRNQIRYLKGIKARSNIGVLSINEHFANQEAESKAKDVTAEENSKKDVFEQLHINKPKFSRKSSQAVVNSTAEELKQLRYKLTQVGSFLKTPRFPIWIAGISQNNTHFAVLYSTNIELISNWRAERLFDLFCLNPWSAKVEKNILPPKVSMANCLQPIRIQMDAVDRPNYGTEFNIESGDEDSDCDDSKLGVFGTGPAVKKSPPPIELVLQTKWPGAAIDYPSLEGN